MNWEDFFGEGFGEAADLLSKFLVYSPRTRIKASQAQIHSFFYSIRREE